MRRLPRNVVVHTKKIYDSCRSKECLRDIRVYLTRDAQELINAGGIASVKPREAELLSRFYDDRTDSV